MEMDMMKSAEELLRDGNLTPEEQQDILEYLEGQKYDNEVRECVIAADGTRVFLPQSLVPDFLEKHGGPRKLK